jgi:hypothetical protein
VKFDKKDGSLLNKDWLLFPQMRYVALQFLASVVLEDNSKFIVINMIESYGHYTLDHAHHERWFLPELSAFPVEETKYGNIRVVLRSSTKNGGTKLHIASRTCSLLNLQFRINYGSVNIERWPIKKQPSQIFLKKG